MFKWIYLGKSKIFLDKGGNGLKQEMVRNNAYAYPNCSTAKITMHIVITAQ